MRAPADPRTGARGHRSRPRGAGTVPHDGGPGGAPGARQAGRRASRGHWERPACTRTPRWPGCRCHSALTAGPGPGASREGPDGETAAGGAPGLPTSLGRRCVRGPRRARPRHEALGGLQGSLPEVHGRRPRGAQAGPRAARWALPEPSTANHRAPARLGQGNRLRRSRSDVAGGPRRCPHGSAPHAHPPPAGRASAATEPASRREHGSLRCPPPRHDGVCPPG